MNRIKELREEKGWTQEQLGKMLGVQKSAVSKYETGKIPLTADTIQKLAEIFNVTGDYIMGISKIRTNESISDAEATEILKRKFIKHGIIKEGEDITEDQLEDYLKKLSAILSAFKD